MNKRRNLYLLVVVLLALPDLALAETTPRASRVDTRMRDTYYNPDQVYTLYAEIGRATFIQFAPGEEMESFYTGDSAAWDVGKHGNLVALKPTAEVPNTNLIIVTSTGRVYAFDLELHNPPMYGIRFAYPGEERRLSDERRAKQVLDESLDPARQTRRNYRYAGTGSQQLQPSEMWDNGVQTFLRFPENTTYPSAFVIGPDGGETLVNKTIRGNWMILPEVGRQWRLRQGQEVLCIRNDGFAPSGVDNPGETTSRAVERASR